MEKKQEKHLVIFSLANEEYGIDISFVREIIKQAAIVKVPKAPDFVEGIINLRQQIIAVIDLATRLGIGKAQGAPRNRRTIIVEVDEKQIGLVVDSVGEVLRIPPEQVSAVPDSVKTIDTRYLTGVINVAGRLILLMDITQVLNREELRGLAGLEAEAK
jgi:purine-binding chemotaxis protein CheW